MLSHCVQILGKDLVREVSEPKVSDDPTLPWWVGPENGTWLVEPKALIWLVEPEALTWLVEPDGGIEPMWGVSCEPEIFKNKLDTVGSKLMRIIRNYTCTA